MFIFEKDSSSDLLAIINSLTLILKSMVKNFTLLIFTILFYNLNAQNKQIPSEIFWNSLKNHCSKSYEGKITAGGKEGDGFTGKRLVMQVLSCESNRIRIPFYVGENSSRTWVLSKNDKSILKLKHDHRHEDGTEDQVTQYGGQAPNQGLENLQIFPADEETANRISYASTNVWWITLDEKTFSYNLRRIGSDRVFTVEFDLTQPIEFSSKPWGWKQ